MDAKNRPDAAKPVRVIIDTDVSIGIPERDVDDGLALVMASNTKHLAISAITLTYGNSTLRNVSDSMRRLNALLQFPEVSITCGASSASDLGKETPAAQSIIDALEKHNQTIVALGPLTNIATVLTLRPDLATRIDRVVLVAGRRPGSRFLTGNFPLSHPDLNFEKDPKACDVLLRSGIPLTFAPFELSSKIWITEEILDRVRAARTPTGEYLYKNCIPWLELWRRRFSTDLFPVTGFNPFDCLAIACVTDEGLIIGQKCVAVIEEDNYDATDRKVQGTGHARKPYLHVFPDSSGPHVFAFEVAREKFLNSLISRLR